MTSKKKTQKVSSLRQSPRLMGVIFHVMLPFAGEHGQDREVGASHLGNSPWLQLFTLLSFCMGHRQIFSENVTSLVLQLTHPKICICLNWRGKEWWPFRIKSYVVLMMMMSIRTFLGTYNMVCTVLNVLYALSSLIPTTNSVR